MDTTTQRSAPLTLLLGLIVGYDVLSASYTVSNANAILAAAPQLPAWALWTSVGLGMVRALGALLVFASKKVGFALVCVGALGRVAMLVVFSGGFDAIYTLVMSLFVIAVLFGMLARGGDESVWARMR